MKWIQRASVSPGGKAYFFTCMTDKGMFRVVWNRGQELYELQIGDKKQGYYKTAAQAKKIAEKLK